MHLQFPKQMINIIYPSELGSPKKITQFWEKEMEAAQGAGFGVSIASDILEMGPITLTNNTAGSYLYRGWIVKPSYYEELTHVVKAPLLNSHADYMKSYDFPKWYEVMEQYTPSSLIIPAEEIQRVGLQGIAEQVAKSTNGQATSFVMKDYLKSRKHEWYDACFIRDARDQEDVVRVMTNFFNLQGRDFYGGLVFRKFLSLKRLGLHPQSKMPLPVEFRTFFLNQKPIVTTPYWNNDFPYPEGTSTPPQEWLEKVGQKLISPFVALDIAQDEDDKWWVIEVNDGGSAGIPDVLAPKDFYSSLYEGLTK